MLFSERKGYKPVRAALQKESMDDALRTELWNVYYEQFISGSTTGIDKDSFYKSYWRHFFKKMVDTIPYKDFFEYVDSRQYYSPFIKYMHDFIKKCEWHEVYSFIEYALSLLTKRNLSTFKRKCNDVMQMEMSAYRIVGNQVVEITSEEEIACIEECLDNTDSLTGINTHIQSALGFLSDRNNPDFRNSIKESISAVEALAQQLTSNPKATLGSALKVIEKSKQIHPALKASLSSLYGYTSDEGGIRHAMLEDPNLTFNDAKFMLVACTAFINYLIGKAAEQGISLS
ncbi:MAG: hypothetical protein NTW26_07020 [bacterium]|nr:hypothetical protein [bacterium]